MLFDSAVNRSHQTFRFLTVESLREFDLGQPSRVALLPKLLPKLLTVLYRVRVYRMDMLAGAEGIGRRLFVR